MIASFVDGMNAYATANPDNIADDKKVVLPVTVDDIQLHSMFVILTRFVAGGELGQVQNWRELGSNTYAVGPSRTASGKAMLVQNPHLPWFGEFLFYEAHLNAPDVNTYGATLVGLPVLGIAFNENLGWSHTNNTIDNADLYELTLDGEGYQLDGEVKAFEQSEGKIKVKTPDDQVIDHQFKIFKSVHGPVLRMGSSKGLAIRFPGTDHPNGGLQWWNMGTAQNFEEFESALKMLQIPFFNIMYADKVGNIFYMFNGLVPQRSSGDWDFWESVVPGDKSEYIWQELHTYEDLPKIKNPEIGWLQNANDPPWTSTFPMLLDAKNFPPYMAPEGMSFRPQRSARMLAEDESITFEELVDYKLSTRIEAADRLLDDLFAAIDEHGSELGREAKTVLENWDREANADSKGMLLFYNWTRKMNLWDQRNYSKPWSLDEARTSPDGLADPAQAVAKLEEAAQELKEKLGQLDVPWGMVYRLRRGEIDLPGNGAEGSVGIFRVAWPGGQDDGKLIVGGGDSWVSVIEFGDKVKAKVLLSYGNSSQPGSPHNGDQLELFSKNELRDAWFYREDLEGHIEKTETLGAEGFQSSTNPQ